MSRAQQYVLKTALVARGIAPLRRFPLERCAFSCPHHGQGPTGAYHPYNVARTCETMSDETEHRSVDRKRTWRRVPAERSLLPSRIGPDVITIPSLRQTSRGRAATRTDALGARSGRWRSTASSASDHGVFQINLHLLPLLLFCRREIRLLDSRQHLLST